MAIVTIPRTVKLWIAWAKQDPDVSALIGTRATSRLPEFGPSKAAAWPWITVTRVGGSADELAIVDAFIEFKVHAGPKGTGDGNAPNEALAESTAATLEAALAQLDNVTVPGEGHIYSFDVVTARPADNPDNPGWGLYIVDGIGMTRAE